MKTEREDLIQKAYKSVGYRPTKDHMIINDRLKALSKLSDKELLQIINK
jgi:hypothetical protein